MVSSLISLNQMNLKHLKTAGVSKYKKRRKETESRIKEQKKIYLGKGHQR